MRVTDSDHQIIRSDHQIIRPNQLSVLRLYVVVAERVRHRPLVVEHVADDQVAETRRRTLSDSMIRSNSIRSDSDDSII